MATSPANAIGLRSAPTSHSWTADDAILYALGVGARPYADIGFVFEGHGPRVLPTFAATVAMSGSHLIGEIPGIDLGGIIDGGQSIALHRELPPAATVSLCSEVTAIWDKGTSAVIEVSTTASDEAGALFTSGMTMVARGAGGFGGDRGPSAKSSNVPPVREPDDVVSYETRIEQGALYRLTGDLHPVHIDPEAAKMAGFEAPVLHGLCTYGFVGRAIVGSVCKGNPARLRLFEGRFASPVHPGDEIITRIWHENTGAVVQADNQHGDPVLANAKAEVGPP